MSGLKRIKTVAAFAVALGVLASSAAPAWAAGAAPQWTISAVSRPTTFALSARPGEDAYVVFVTNTGSAASSGTVVIDDELPSGLAPVTGDVTAEDELVVKDGEPNGTFGNGCAGTGSGGVTCAYGGVVVPDDTLVLKIPVRVSAGGAGDMRNVVRVSGGGAFAQARVEIPTQIAESEKQTQADTAFGIAPGSASTALSSVQAGAHADITTSYGFDTLNASGATAGNLKSIVTEEPPGVALDLVNTPACQPGLFLREECPVPTQVGITTVIAYQGGPEPITYLQPVYNIAPEPGTIAKLGFAIGQFKYEGDVELRPPGEEDAYGGRVTFYNIGSGSNEPDGGTLTLWGVPASPIHDPLRWRVEEKDNPASGRFGHSSNAIEASFFTLPTSCGSEPLHAEFRVTSWQHPGEGENPFDPETESMPFGPLVGCDGLSLSPSLTAETTSDSADAPSGFDLLTTIPQTYEDPEGVATAAVRSETVTLPAGMTIDPSSGAGLTACSEAQYQQEAAPEKTAGEREEGRGCPNSSKLASVKIKTPLLSEEVTGSVYLAEPAPRGEPGRNPFDSLLALYLIARIPGRGVLVKAPGLVELGEPNGANGLSEGQIRTTFGLPNALEGERPEGGLPPLPFSDAKFEFNQGANAPLVTPATCGEFTVQAALVPWSDSTAGFSSSEDVLTPPVPPFAIDTGVGGGACPAGGIPFHPQVMAGTSDNDAGSYSPLSLRILRQDGEQEITGFSTQLPPGLTGNLTGIPECGEAEVKRAREQTGAEAEASPACPAASQIGSSLAEAGVGSVLVQTPGRIYLGGPYEGAPFSVVSVTSAKVGPFDLGTVVIHFPLEINPETAQVTIPAGPVGGGGAGKSENQIPHIIDGIVIHVRNIYADIDREKFMLNPTSCNPMSLVATVIGAGANPADTAGYDPVSVSGPFQMADCSNLKFEPKFSASTSGKTSKADGASLHVSLAYPAGALGQDANIRYVKVELPKALPSRLTTLQKACTQAQFRASPAGCPAASVIGYAKAKTPILPVPLEGPVYFVSNGGEAFPNLIMVLQGDGVRIDLVGDTYISSSGITSSTFKAVPDQPVESFELTLPEGPYSALGTNKDLCKPTTTKIVKEKVKVRAHGHTRTVTRKVRKTVAEALTMPTEFIAQNGATFTQTTSIAVTGCPKGKAAKKGKKGKKGKGKGRGK